MKFNVSKRKQLIGVITVLGLIGPIIPVKAVAQVDPTIASNNQNYIKIEAEDYLSTMGKVSITQNLPGYSGSGYLDIAIPNAPVDRPDTTGATKLTDLQDGVSWQVYVPKAGRYKINYVYNNPATESNHWRNARDERNMRVTLNSKWVGWVIFSKSGEFGNGNWNNNPIFVDLKAGKNILTLQMEAPPGQAVYDGPNIDYFTVTPDKELIPEKKIPYFEGKFAHPGVYYKKADLDLMKKEALSSGDNIWKRGFQQIMADPKSSLSYQSKPSQLVERGPYNNPNIGADNMLNDAVAAHNDALIWYVTGNEAYAKKAIEIMNGWSYTLKDITNNDARLLVAMTSQDIVNAAEIIRHCYNTDPAITAENKWQEKDIAQFEGMLRNVYYKTIKDFYPQANGNWDALMTSAMMEMGVFLDDTNMFNRALRQFYRGDAVGDGTASMGSIASYIYPTGEAQESNRDQVHNGMGLDGLSFSAEVAWNQGLDLYKAYHNRLAVGSNYNAQYNLQAIDPTVPNVKSDTYISDKSKGTASAVVEIIANHYTNEVENANVKIPFTLRSAIELKREAHNSYTDAFKFERLPKKDEDTSK